MPDRLQLPQFVGFQPAPLNGRPADAPRPAPAPRVRERVDYEDVKLLRKQIQGKLTDELTARGTDATARDRRVLGEEIAAAVVKDLVDQKLRSGQALSDAYEAALLSAVRADMFGAGRFQAMLDDPNVENIMVKGFDEVRIDYADGRTELGEPVAESDEDLVDFLRHLARRGFAERALSTSQPRLYLTLDDGSRLTAVFGVTPRPVVTIRRHRTRDVDLNALVRLGMIDSIMERFLTAVMGAHLNTMIVGLPGAGKTTLLRGMAAQVPEGEWWATLEQEFELHLHENGRHPWVVPFEAREGFGERGPDGRPVGEVSISDLIPLMLRLNMTRFMVGEVRSTEIVPMLEAMGTCRGSLCTMHARTPDTVFSRIVELALRHGPSMTAALAYQMAASALDYIVYVEMVDETMIGGRKHRFVSHIIEVQSPRDGLTPFTTNVFAPGADGRGRPAHRPERTHEILTRAGFDLSLLQNKHGTWANDLDLRVRR